LYIHSTEAAIVSIFNGVPLIDINIDIFPRTLIASPELQKFFQALQSPATNSEDIFLFSKKLTGLDTNSKQLHKTIYSLLSRSKKTVLSSEADASELFSAYFVDKIRRFARVKPSTTHYSTPNASCNYVL